jgi:putative oxidoreductase
VSRESLSSFVAAAGRLLLAAIFIMAGASKLGTSAATQDYIAGSGLPVPVLAYWVAVLVELGGGIALALGWRVRAAAAVLALFTVVAALAFHAHFDDQNQSIHFLKNFAIVGGLLQIVALGSGGFTLDALLRRFR